jgi:hypothetical protein
MQTALVLFLGVLTGVDQPPGPRVAAAALFAGFALTSLGEQRSAAFTQGAQRAAWAGLAALLAASATNNEAATPPGLWGAPSHLAVAAISALTAVSSAIPALLGPLLLCLGLLWNLAQTRASVSWA